MQSGTLFRNFTFGKRNYEVYCEVRATVEIQDISRTFYIIMLSADTNTVSIAL